MARSRTSWKQSVATRDRSTSITRQQGREGWRHSAMMTSLYFITLPFSVLINLSNLTLPILAFNTFLICHHVKVKKSYLSIFFQYFLILTSGSLCEIHILLFLYKSSLFQLFSMVANPNELDANNPSLQSTQDEATTGCFM